MKAHIRLYHPTLGWRVIKKRRTGSRTPWIEQPRSMETSNHAVSGCGERYDEPDDSVAPLAVAAVLIHEQAPHPHSVEEGHLSLAPIGGRVLEIRG